jgi:hypothetical protein
MGPQSSHSPGLIGDSPTTTMSAFVDLNDMPIKREYVDSSNVMLPSVEEMMVSSSGSALLMPLWNEPADNRLLRSDFCLPSWFKFDSSHGPATKVRVMSGDGQTGEIHSRRVPTVDFPTQTLRGSAVDAEIRRNGENGLGAGEILQKPGNVQACSTQKIAPTTSRHKFSHLAPPGLESTMIMHLPQLQPQIFMPIDETRSHRGCGPSAPRRPRSAAIAITRDPHTSAAAVVDDDVASADRTYDWATWRMYNRIVDHRLKHPIKHPQAVAATASSPENPEVATIIEDDSRFPPVRKGSSMPPPSVYDCRHEIVPVPEDDEMDGEIFDFEL